MRRETHHRFGASAQKPNLLARFATPEAKVGQALATIHFNNGLDGWGDRELSKRLNDLPIQT